MNVHKKLMIARLKLQQLPLKKSGHNKFAGYQYFELGDFLPSVQDLFGEVGLCGTVSFGTDIAKLTITNIDDPTQFIEFTSPMSSAALKGCHEVQNLGAVQSYLRRYLWVTALEIVEHDTLDATTGKDEPKKAEPTESSPRIVGKVGQWQIDAPADPIGGDVKAWLDLIKESTHYFLDLCDTSKDVVAIFNNNKELFINVKTVDPQFFADMIKKFTEVKTKLDKEPKNGN